VYCVCNHIYAVTGASTGSSACFITGCLELENFIAAALHTQTQNLTLEFAGKHSKNTSPGCTKISS